jgi:hypothetical protein
MKVYCIGLYDNSTQKYAYFPTFTFEKDATNVKIFQDGNFITLEYSGAENLLNTSQIDIVKKGIIPSVTGTPSGELQSFADEITKNKKIPFAMFIEFYKNPNSPITGEYTAAQLMLMDGITKNPAKNQKGELICDIHNDVPLEKANLNNKTNLNAINDNPITQNGPDQSIKSLKPTILVALKQGAVSMFSKSPVQSSTTAQTTPICTFMKKVIENTKNPAPGPIGHAVVAVPTGASGAGGPTVVSAPTNTGASGPVSTNTSPVGGPAPTNTGASGGPVSTNTGAAPNATVVAASTNAGTAGGVVNTNTGGPTATVAVSNSNSNISASINQNNAASTAAGAQPPQPPQGEPLYDYIIDPNKFDTTYNTKKYDFTTSLIENNGQSFLGFYFPYSENDIKQALLRTDDLILELVQNFFIGTSVDFIKDNSFVILFELSNDADVKKNLITLGKNFVFTEYFGDDENAKQTTILKCIKKMTTIITKVNTKGNTKGKNLKKIKRIILPYTEDALKDYFVIKSTKGGALKRIAQQTSIPRIYRPVSQRKTDYYNYT